MKLKKGHVFSVSSGFPKILEKGFGKQMAFKAMVFAYSFCLLLSQFFFFFFGQILEVEGMSVPDEVSSMLQMVSEYLKEPCPITSLSGSQGPTPGEGLKHAHGDDGAAKVRRQANQVETDEQDVLWLFIVFDHVTANLWRYIYFSL